VAEIVAVVAIETALVLMANVALLVPSAIRTVAGTVAAGLLLETLTVIPPEGALSLRLMNPVAPTPPMTETGETATPVSAGCGLTTCDNAVEELVK
jgi:hypothetical protein